MVNQLGDNREFKDSVLGKIPKDWDALNLEKIANINSESLGVETPSNFQFKYIDISSVEFGVINWETVTNQIFSKSPSRARRIVRPNDILICTVRPALQAHTFANWDDYNGYICSTGFAVIRVNQDIIKPRYLYHIIFANTISKQLRQREIGSNYPAVNETDIHQLFIPVPRKIEEQEQIAKILDTVDKAIAQTETLIAKYKRVKTGLMQDLLTRGIDENGQLRDPKTHKFKRSPLGMIPDEKDWICDCADSLCLNISVGIVIQPSKYYCEFGIPALRSANIGENEINTNELVFISERSNQLLSKSIIGT